MSETTRQVVKVVLKGAVTSFRYPHFVQQVQPTYEMPPPSTIYGHLCNAVGKRELDGLEEIAFALHFTYEAKFRDLEHIHLEIPYLQANPFQRELLFNPKLTLYISPANHMEYFLKPRYPVALGRSQDLMTYESVKEVTLQRAEAAYFEHTLIPQRYAALFRRTTAVTMAQFIDPYTRQPSWAQYAILKDRVKYPDEELPDVPLLLGNTPPPEVWVDLDVNDEEPYTTYEGLYRGLIFHRFA